MVPEPANFLHFRHTPRQQIDSDGLRYIKIATRASFGSSSASVIEQQEKYRKEIMHESESTEERSAGGRPKYKTKTGWLWILLVDIGYLIVSLG